MNIKEIVIKYFGLDEESKERFLEAYDNPFIDDIYKPFVGDDYRIRVPLVGSLYENFDKGWSTFKSILPELVSNYRITYEEFYNNKKIQGKNHLRIIKMIRSYFNEDICEEKILNFLRRMGDFEPSKFYEYRDYCEDNGIDIRSKESIGKAVNLFIDRINELRFSKNRNIEIVLSFNRDDWFLSTTNENWRTCLSLESPSFASYWVSLAGAVIDKNIALLYITNGEKKSYFNNKVDKVLSRSWVLLDKDSNLNMVKFYPTSILSIKDISKVLPLEIKDISYDFISKYRVKPLLFRNGYSNYLYQDKTEPSDYKDGSFNLIYGGKGLFTFYGDKIFEGPIFNYTNGLHELVSANRNSRNMDIIDFFTPPLVCSDCGCLISAGRNYMVDERTSEKYCEICWGTRDYQNEDSRYDENDNEHEDYNENDGEDPFNVFFRRDLSPVYTMSLAEQISSHTEAKNTLYSATTPAFELEGLTINSPIAVGLVADDITN